MFIDFINLFSDPNSFIKSLPVWAFFIAPHIPAVAYLTALYALFKIPTIQKVANNALVFFMLFLYLLISWSGAAFWGHYSRGVLEYHGAIPDSFSVVLGYTLWYVFTILVMLAGVAIQTAIIVSHIPVEGDE